MACFVVPAGTAIVTTVIRKKIPEKYHIDWLNAMLWGGVVMLAVEHVSHGEVVLYPPFLTAGIPEVLPEMLKVGVPMTLAILLVWGVMVAVARSGFLLDSKLSPSYNYAVFGGCPHAGAKEIHQDTAVRQDSV